MFKEQQSTAEENIFLSVRPSLLSNYALIRARLEYRQARAILCGLPGQVPERLCLQLSEALCTIEQELQARRSEGTSPPAHEAQRTPSSPG